MAHLHLHSEAFAAKMKELMQEYRVPGVSVATTSNTGDTAKSFGYASQEPEVPCTSETLFDIASASKSMTAAAVALLVEDEAYPQVRWETPVANLLPDDFVLLDERYTHEVTVEDILSHRSGFPSHDNSYLSERAKHPDDARSVTRNLRNLPMESQPRTKFMYCNIMYTVASYIVERMSGMAFSEYLEEKLFKPLEMSSTSLQSSRAREKGFGDQIALGHSWDDKAKAYRQFQAYDCKEGQGAGAIITSAEDYLKWVKALMNRKGPITGAVYSGLIKMRAFPYPDPEARDIPINSSPLAYAAGLEIFWYRGHLVVAHGGSIPIFGSTHFFLPKRKFGGVILGNASDASDLVDALMWYLIDEALGVPLIERMDWSHPHGRAIDEDDQGDGLDKVRKMLSFHGGESEPLTNPMSWYVGVYSNPGYHQMTVGMKDGELFIDASDRTDGGLFIRLEHLCQQSKFIAHISSTMCDDDESVAAEFRLGNARAIKMGLHLEVDLKELIWFERVEGISSNV